MSASQYSASTTLSPMKVLLVEDSILIRDALIEVLSNTDDLTVKGVAATQNGAIALLNEQQFDMLLVDIELAQGNGFEVIKHTQTKEYAFKQPVFVMLTNHANPQYRRLAKDLGVNYFFDKSMDFDIAIETIELEANRFSNAEH
ncbi:MAG TPA: response regulator [Methylotenera sp.]|nr:response regulator [Methylotenera sp.]